MAVPGVADSGDMVPGVTAAGGGHPNPPTIVSLESWGNFVREPRADSAIPLKVVSRESWCKVVREPRADNATPFKGCACGSWNRALREPRADCAIEPNDMLVPLGLT